MRTYIFKCAVCKKRNVPGKIRLLNDTPATVCDACAERVNGPGWDANGSPVD